MLVTEAQATVRWLHRLGVRYRLMYERQAYERPDGTFLFWGGLHIGNVGGGEGLMADHVAVARAPRRSPVVHGCAATALIVDDGRVVGVTATGPDGPVEWRAESVVLAAGGFEADPALRRRYLGAGWEHAKVRGTPHNTGEMLDAALRIGAAQGRRLGECAQRPVGRVVRAQREQPRLTNRLTRQSYPLGIIVNRDGQRFVDEGADFRNYTYAKYGRAILEQPGSIAFQIFDARLRPMLRTEEYDMPGISVEVADTIAGLAEQIGVDPTRLSATVAAFNASIDTTRPFDPTIKDGRRAAVVPPKSNWASALDSPPFYAYPVTCGITFTFGGLRGDTDGRVLDDRRPTDPRPVRLRRDARRPVQRQLPRRNRPRRRHGLRPPRRLRGVMATCIRPSCRQRHGQFEFDPLPATASRDRLRRSAS